MKPDNMFPLIDPALLTASDYALSYRQRANPVHPAEGGAELRQRFCIPLAEKGVEGEVVIRDLIAAAEPGLVGNTDPGFLAWVMGSSHTTGVAADWLTSVWGQNAAIFQTAPAAAIAEEAVSNWLLDLLDFDPDCGVGFVTGATMAGFTCLAAARRTVLARSGHDLDRIGLQGAPLVRIFLSEDAHVSNFTSLRYLGFGELNIKRVASDGQGVMKPEALAAALARIEGPKIIIGQAGHINSGGFDNFDALAKLAHQYSAWLHIDGAFGLWARVLPEKDHLTKGLELADSWAVDGHKWLQIPYDSGFAIVRDRSAMRAAMAMSANYLNQSPDDGRNPTEFNPELSRRARGFAVWAVLRSLGRTGVRDLIRGHCDLAAKLARRLAQIEGISVLNRVDCNQIALVFGNDRTGADQDRLTQAVADRLNANGNLFLRTAVWRERTILRVSIISGNHRCARLNKLANLISSAWQVEKDQVAADQTLR